MQLSLQEISATLGAATSDSSLAVAKGYSIDSRTITSGQCFFAVRGLRFDGHEFVRAALESGACAAVIASEKLSEYPQELRARLIAVPDPALGLQRLAAHVRRKWAGPVVAITGSTGKTTTKQMISSLLSTRFRVHQNEGNLNNQFGLPLSLLKLEGDSQIGVFELGMSAAGEIRFLSSLARPDVGVVTNVGEAHLEFFSSVEEIAEAKFELIDSLDSTAWAVLNADDYRVSGFGPLARAQVIYYGTNQDAHVKAREIKPIETGGYRFRLPVAPMKDMPCGAVWNGHKGGPPPVSGKPRDAVFHMPLLGRHNISNVLAAAAVCRLFGIEPETLEQAVSELQPLPMRGEVTVLANGARVVLDCYNSSPTALEAMLEAVAELPAQRRIAVLGGMKELGESSAALHFRCGERVQQAGIHHLIVVGEDARSLRDGAVAAGMSTNAVEMMQTPEEAGERLRGMLGAGDVALLKASRAVRLERVWEIINSN
ncbi:MAG: UDP-N-acetylmuramoyl-tripeptide--D-alanyl-D-alanine ligase [Acidobacteria bacterium]|nr:UDP-N-acetylmuramoyl-tripeptide--D-alanyl-D-alanine ligase [Acidobacteriota bacterium]